VRELIMTAIVNYLIRVGDAISQLINVAFLFGQSANESISGRAWRQRNTHRSWGIMRILIDWIASPLESDHCEKSYNNDVVRAALLLKNKEM